MQGHDPREFSEIQPLVPPPPERHGVVGTPIDLNEIALSIAGRYKKQPGGVDPEAATPSLQPFSTKLADDYSAKLTIDYGRSKDHPMNPASFTVQVFSDNASPPIVHVAKYRFNWPVGAMRDIACEELLPAFEALKSPSTAAAGLQLLKKAEEQGFVYQVHPTFIDPHLFPEVAEKIEGKSAKEALQILLKEFQINTESWGKTAKGLDHLLVELEAGESKLGRDERGLFLATTVARIDIFYQKDNGEWLKLREKFQRLQFEDGIPTIKERAVERTIGEKMLPYESGRQAALRGMAEELGVTGKLVKDSGMLSVVDFPSTCYPGLNHRVLFYDFEATLRREQYQPNRVHPTARDKDGKSPLIFAYEEIGSDKNIYFQWVYTEEGPKLNRGPVMKTPSAPGFDAA